MRPLALIEAPSSLGLRAQGVERLPDTLRGLGLDERLGPLASVEAVPVPAADGTLKSGVLNQAPIRSFSQALADHVGRALDANEFPLLLGGDCSILLGAGLALRRRGRYGLAFLDGHADFYSAEAETTGEVASMELAIATGHEPAELADIDGLRPYFREQDVVALGVSDLAVALAEGSPDIRRSNIHVIELQDLRRLDPREAAMRSIKAFQLSELDGFWIHLDADVLDDDLMPAVDYRLAGGLAPDELAELLATLLASPLASGMQVTIYNPTLDDGDLSAGRVLVDVLGAAFQRVRLFSATA